MTTKNKALVPIKSISSQEPDSEFSLLWLVKHYMYGAWKINLLKLMWRTGLGRGVDTKSVVFFVLCGFMLGPSDSRFSFFFLNSSLIARPCFQWSQKGYDFTVRRFDCHVHSNKFLYSPDWFQKTTFPPRQTEFPQLSQSVPSTNLRLSSSWGFSESFSWLVS